MISPETVVQCIHSRLLIENLLPVNIILSITFKIQLNLFNIGMIDIAVDIFWLQSNVIDCVGGFLYLINIADI
jgi:hypothetical protein